MSRNPILKKVGSSAEVSIIYHPFLLGRVHVAYPNI